jgi:hypothetical protein
MDAFDHGLPHTFEGSGEVADGLTGITNAFLCVFSFLIVGEYTGVLKCPRRYKFRRLNQNVVGFYLGNYVSVFADTYQYELCTCLGVGNSLLKFVQTLQVHTV